MTLIQGPLTPRAIETVYADTRFRSRLEAKWATFFDLIGWPWLYEPIDLDGYIPDFILQFHRPLLVEVKPAVLLEELQQHAEKINASGWNGEALIVGAALWPTVDWWGSLAVGLLGEHFPGHQPGDRGWGTGRLFRCTICGRLSLHHDVSSFHCRVAGCNDDHYYGALERDLFAELWADAGNHVRYLRHAARIPRVTVDARVSRGWRDRKAAC
jgi:hypothetical protein